MNYHPELASAKQDKLQQSAGPASLPHGKLKFNWIKMG